MHSLFVCGGGWYHRSARCVPAAGSWCMMGGTDRLSSGVPTYANLLWRRRTRWWTHNEGVSEGLVGSIHEMVGAEQRRASSLSSLSSKGMWEGISFASSGFGPHHREGCMSHQIQYWILTYNRACATVRITGPDRTLTESAFVTMITRHPSL